MSAHRKPGPEEQRLAVKRSAPYWRALHDPTADPGRPERERAIADKAAEAIRRRASPP